MLYLFMGKIMGLSDFLGGTSQNRRENFYVFNPSPQKQLFLRCFPYIAPRHPVILRDTAGEKGYKQTDEMSFSTPPSLRATSPIFCVTKHRGGVLNVSDCETEILYKATGTWRERRFKVSLQCRYAHLSRSKCRLSHHCIRIVLVIK